MEKTRIKRLAEVFKGCNLFVFEKVGEWYITNNCFMYSDEKEEIEKVLVKMGHTMQGAGFYYLGKNKKSVCNNWTPENKKVLGYFSNNLATISSMSIHLDKSRSNSKDALVVRIIFGDNDTPMYFNEKYIDIIQDILEEGGFKLVTNTSNNGNFNELGGIYIIDENHVVKMCFMPLFLREFDINKIQNEIKKLNSKRVFNT